MLPDEQFFPAVLQLVSPCNGRFIISHQTPLFPIQESAFQPLTHPKTYLLRRGAESAGKMDNMNNLSGSQVPIWCFREMVCTKM